MRIVEIINLLKTYLGSKAETRVSVKNLFTAFSILLP